MKKTTLLRHAHLSGRFDVTDDELFAALTALALVADVVTITEVATHDAPLRAWAKAHGWHLFHPHRTGRSECAVLSRTPIVEHRATRLTPLTLKRGRTAPIYLVEVRPEHGPWVCVWHSPAHNGGLSASGRFAWPTKVYVSALLGLKVARRAMRGHRVVLAGDWNLDLARAVIRARIGDAFPRLAWGWTPGQKPTEGGRVIDGVLTNLPIAEPSETLPRLGGFDHRPVLTVYTLAA